jgi:hypothetical protein
MEQVMQFNWSQAAGSCAGVLILGAVMTLSGAAQFSQNASFNTVTLQRIDVREPDGTLRMVISNGTRAPGIIIKGQEYHHPSRQSAGMIFFNNEGTENGGLIFDGRQSSDGVRQSSGSLTFDRYEQDQVVQLAASEDGQTRSGGVIVNDQPEPTINWAAIDRSARLKGAAQIAAVKAANAGSTQRAFFGRGEDKSSELVLRDEAGRKRLILHVSAAGEASIDFVDSNGKVERRLDPSGH